MKFKTFSFITALACCAITTQAENLNVYSYDSFTSDWGAGPKIKTLFEQKFPQCQLQYTTFDSAGTMFNRIRLEGNKLKADIVLGLDNYMLDEAQHTGLFTKNAVDLNTISLPLEWNNQTFLPYDFGLYAFIYDKNKLPHPPKSLKELVERQDLKIIYQDPRTSSVGQGLMVWLNAVYPQDQVASAWQTLAKHTVTVGKGWSSTYGAFLKGEADLVLSQNTSPLYHLINEKKDNYAATEFSEGNILQIELAAKVAGRNNNCADHFMAFLISPTAQKEIALYNTMLPVSRESIEPHYDALKAEVATKLILNTQNVKQADLKKWIDTWQRSLIK
ncbi:thiamine ABC transporter substrate binding subunit [Seminibacterium arietis]|uniref:Thiamine-binding periplasmic protein n=1 Tax=Seminibacterium arietis TaxID=1173502 RepID=A0ABW3I7S8_9PAST